MKMKFIFAIISLIVFSLSHPAQALEDSLIAIINNEIITQKDLDDFVNFMRVQLSAQYSEKETGEKIDQMGPDLINRLVEDRLILQAAQKEDIVIDQNRIKARVGPIRQRYRSEADFLNALTAQGLTLADVELKIEEQLLMMEIIERQIRSKIVVKPQEVTDYYSAHSQDLKAPEQRQVRLVTIKDSKLARRMERAIAKYGDLDKIAETYSLEIIDLDWVIARQLKPEIADEVFGLEEGALWLHLDKDGDSYIFEVKSIKPPEEMSLSEAQKEISSFLFETKMQTALVEWLDELRAGAYIDIKKDYGAD